MSHLTILSTDLLPYILSSDTISIESVSLIIAGFAFCIILSIIDFVLINLARRSISYFNQDFLGLYAACAAYVVDPLM